MIKIQWLNAFCTVVETGHFQTAADALFVSQQALSKTILQLEAHLGVDLLERKGRRRFQVLTPAGKVFYQRARRIRAQVQDLENDFLPVQSTTAQQHLRLGAILNIDQEIAALLKKYIRKYQGLIPQLYQALPSQELEQKLLMGDLDLGIMVNQPRNGELAYHQLQRSPFVIVGHPSLARKSWDKLDYVVPLMHHSDLSQALDVWPEESYPRTKVAEADIATCIQFCYKGRGCLYVPFAFVRYPLFKGDLAMIADPPFQHHLESYLVWSPQQLENELISAFIQDIKNIYLATQSGL